MCRTSVIVPAYNEGDSIEDTLEKLTKLKELLQCEIVVVNDGSTDDTHEKITSFMEKKGVDVTYLRHEYNLGYGAALKTGMKQARHEIITIIDADATYPFDRIRDLLDTLEQDKACDMVVGSRTGDDVTYPLLKKIPKYFIKKLAVYISGRKIPDINSGLRSFKKSVAMKFFRLYPQGFSFTTTITMAMLCSGYEVRYININYYKRVGKSKIKPIRDTLRFFELLLRMAMYFNPLKVFMPMALLGMGVSAFVLGRDVWLGDLTQGSVLMPIATMLFLSIGLLADMIVKKI